MNSQQTHIFVLRWTGPCYTTSWIWMNFQVHSKLSIHSKYVLNMKVWHLKQVGVLPPCHCRKWHWFQTRSGTAHPHCSACLAAWEEAWPGNGSWDPCEADRHWLWTCVKDIQWGFKLCALQETVSFSKSFCFVVKFEPKRALAFAVGKIWTIFIFILKADKNWIQIVTS